MTGRLPQPRPRREAAWSIGLAAILAVVLAVVFGLRTGPGPLPDPPTGPDRVPAGPVVTVLPANCGISARTVGRLVPRPSMWKEGASGQCQWSSRDRDDRRPFLAVNVTLHSGTRLPEMLEAGRTPIAQAMASFAQKWSDSVPEPVTGLGDEAIVQYSGETGATVMMRVGNATALVQYRDFSRTLPEKAALDAAFTAATEVSASLGAPPTSRPAIGPVPAVLAAGPVDICAAVSKRTRERLIEGDVSDAASGRDLTIQDSETTRCGWASNRQALRVSAVVLPGTELFGGEQQAAREYAKRHLDARGEEPLSRDDEKYFRAVTGLGDQAFAAYVAESLPGQVVFRHRNRLVQVVYTEADGAEPLTRKQSVHGAYEAAREVARALPR